MSATDDEKKLREKLHADNREQAKAAWTNVDNAVIKSAELTAQIGTQALRGPGLLNAAGTAALLGLLSANARHLKLVEPAVASALGFFIVGATASAVALGFSYFAQRLWTYEKNDHTKSISHPYVTQNKRHKILTGNLLLAFATGLAVASFLCFASGAWRVILIARHIASSAP